MTEVSKLGRSFLTRLQALALGASIGAMSSAALDYPVNTWSRAQPANETEARALSGMTWDSVNGQVLMFGGGDRGWWGNQVTVYDPGRNTWFDFYDPEPISDYELLNPDGTVDCAMAVAGVAVTPGGLPWVRHTDDNLAFDSVAGLMVLHGGVEGSICTHGTDNTWVFDPSVPYAPEAAVPTNPWTWMNPTARGNPGPTAASSMVYDSDTGLFVMFGGTGSSSTWIYNLAENTWTEDRSLVRPPRRFSPNMEYDSINKRVILFGGWASGKVFDDTWTYDVTNRVWEDVSPEVSPPARLGHGMAFDSRNGVVVLWGGKDLSDHTFADTWVFEYSSNRWIEIRPINRPVANVPRGSMVYDPKRDAVYLANFRASSWPWNSQAGSNFTETWVFRYAPGNCAGDCDFDGVVSASELREGVHSIFDSAALDACRVFDRSGIGRSNAAALTAAILHAANGCP